MIQHKVGYIGGINQDLSKDKYDNQHYFNASNIRVVTSKGLSTGSIENEKGNTLLFSFPTIGARYKVTAGALGTVTIDGNIISVAAADTLEIIYNKIIANSSISTLITNKDIYVFFNDTGVYIQILDTTITVTGTLPTVVSAATSSVYICGWCRINEWIIVFTSNSETENPTSALCQIWKFKFTSGSRTQIANATTAGVLDASTHLIYNDILNYSTVTYIRDTVANYETDTKGRVYFTDYFNQIRVANVFDAALMSVKPADLGLIAEVLLGKPTIQSVTNTGNLPVGATYQYFYRLLDTDGRETIFSPGSQLVDLQEGLSNISTQNSADIKSSSAGVTNNKAISISINDIDTDYNVLELYVVLWESLDSPSVYKVSDNIVTGSSMTFTHTTLDNNINIPIASFMSISVPFTAKTLEDRDKVLVAANIKETTFDIDFDARMYRHDSGGDFELFDINDTSTNFTTTYGGLYSNIPEDHDAINPSNDDTNTTYNMESANRQIFQSDGSTLGGEGTNGSFTFVTHARIGSSGSRALRTASAENEGYNIVESSDRLGSSATETLFEKNSDASSINYDVSGEINNTSSSKINALFTGYARGEVYRIGVVFYSKAGQRSYVKWICDIKFPDPSISSTYKISDAAHHIYNNPDVGNTKTYTYDVGLSITLNIASIQDQISGYEFVRVKRTFNDRTRLGSGVVTNFVKMSSGRFNDNYTRTLVRKYAYYRNAAQKNDPIDGIIQIGTTNYGDSSVGEYNYILNDSPDILGDNFNVAAIGYSRYILNFTSPLSEFRAYTSFSPNVNSDYIRDYGYYTCWEEAYNDDSLNTEATANNFRKHNWGFLYRAKKFKSLSDVSQTAQNYQLETERYLSTGEVIYNDGSVTADEDLLGASLSSTNSAFVNTSYTRASQATPYGIGTKKQFFRLKTSGVASWATSGSSLNYKQLNDSDAAQTAPGGSTPGGAPEDGTIATDSQIYKGTQRYFKEVGYCRVLTNQYGGDGYEARSKNIYMSTGSYQIVTVDTATTQTTSVYGGDTYTVSYGREYMRQYWQNPEGIFNDPDSAADSEKTSIGFVFCCESPINTSFRTGEYFGGESDDVANYFRGSLDPLFNRGDLSREEDFIYNTRHNQQNTVRTDYLPKDPLLDDVNKFPNRFKVSNTKIDGEFTDSWRVFPVNQFDDTDGSLGEIHKILAFKDQLYFFQDRGIGILPINERAVIEDVTGAELVLGNGNLIGKYKYLTNTSGTRHQHSVVASDNMIYYFDSLQNKIYPIQGGSISEALGMSSFFHNNLKEILRDSDDLYKANPVGVTSVYDKKNERVLFTFLGGNNIITAADQFYYVDDIVLNGSTYYRCLIQGDYLTTDIISSNNFEELSNYQPGITLNFNERLRAFESEYDYKPGNYLSFDDKLISVNHNTRNSGYVHEEGDYGNFYGNYYSSEITLIVMPNPNVISIFNNLEYYSEISINKEDIVNETLDSVLAYNEHQNTGEISLLVGTLAKRRMRTWRHKLKRDIKGDTLNSIANPRLRNYYLLLKLKFDNNNNKRLVLSDIVISYTPVRM